MTLAALSHIPAQHHQSPSAPGSRWRRGLAIFSKRHKQASPTALAAATEKFIRHTPAQVKCEDLTAKEFAELTGIKIKMDDNCITTNTPLQQTVESDSYERKRYSMPRIWDSDFWHQGSGAGSSLFSACSSSTATTTCPPCECSPLRRSRGPSIITKGRFKIVLGQDDEHDESSQETQTSCEVVEWKRKRTHTTESSDSWSAYFISSSYSQLDANYTLYTFILQSFDFLFSVIFQFCLCIFYIVCHTDSSCPCRLSPYDSTRTSTCNIPKSLLYNDPAVQKRESHGCILVQSLHIFDYIIWLHGSMNGILSFAQVENLLLWSIEKRRYRIFREYRSW